jgi:hypothetical protein
MTVPQVVRRTWVMGIAAHALEEEAMSGFELSGLLDGDVSDDEVCEPTHGGCD